MSHVEITLKSGATITADVSRWAAKRNRLTGALEEVEWTNDGPRQLVTLTLEEVAAVVFVDSDEASDGDDRIEAGDE